MINLSSLEQEKYLNQISKVFEYQSSLIKIYPSSKNFSKCFLDTASLISLLKVNLLTPSNYYLLYIDTMELLQETIEYYIRDNVSKGIKIKYIYESVQQCQYLIPRIYLMIISGSVYLGLYPIKYREIIYDLLNVVKCIQNPLRGFWIRYFLFKSLKNILPIKIGEYISNEEYFFLYRNISLSFLMTNLEELVLFAMRTKKEIYIDDKKIEEKQRINMIQSIEEVIEEISCMKGVDKNIFVNKILPKMFDIIFKVENGNDYYLEQNIISAIIKYFNIELYYESQGISIIFLILRKIIDNKEIDKISMFNNLLNNYTKFIKNIRKNENSSLRNEIMSSITTTFPLFLEKYNELQTTYKNSEEKEFNKFIDLDTIFLKFSLKILKNGKDEQKTSIINIVLNSCSKRLNMFNYGFKHETTKKICSLIEIPLKNKFTVFEFPIIETMIYYLDYNYRKHISIKLIDSFQNKSDKRNKIDSVNKIQKIINLIIPLITESNRNNEGEDAGEYFEEEDKNKNLSKLVYILNTNKPEIMLQMLNEIKTFLNSGSIETTSFTIPTIIYFIINYIKQLDLFNNEYFLKTKKENNENKRNPFDFEFSIEDGDDINNFEMNYINLIKDYINLLKECFLIIENKNQIQTFQIHLIVCCQIKKMNYFKQLDENLFNECFEDFFQKTINIYKNVKEPEIKYSMIQYLNGYLKSSTSFLNEEKIKMIIDLLEKDFSNFNDSEIQFKIAINLSDIYFFILKDNTKIGKYINKAFQILNKNSEKNENLNLLIILINKILYYGEKETQPFYIEMINKAIKVLQKSKLVNSKETKEELKEIYIHYKNTIEYIIKKKNQKSNPLYDSILI